MSEFDLPNTGLVVISGVSLFVGVLMSSGVVSGGYKRGARGKFSKTGSETEPSDTL